MQIVTSDVSLHDMSNITFWENKISAEFSTESSKINFREIKTALYKLHSQTELLDSGVSFNILKSCIFRVLSCIESCL